MATFAFYFFALVAVASGLLVVFAHGAGAGQRSPFMQHYAELLAARGLTVFDLPTQQAQRDLSQWAPICRWLDAA